MLYSIEDEVKETLLTEVTSKVSQQNAIKDFDDPGIAFTVDENSNRKSGDADDVS